METQKDKDKEKLLFQVLKAISKHDLKLLQRIAKNLNQKELKDVVKSKLQGVTPLMMATYTNDINMVSFLVNNCYTPVNQEGLDVASVDQVPTTPVCLASVLGHVEVTKFLIDHGASVNYIDEKGRSCLTCIDMKNAFRRDKFETLKLLVENGADVNFQDRTGETCLMASCKVGVAPVVQYLLEKGASVLQKSKVGWTALHYAGKSGSLEIVKMLIRRNADYHAVDDMGQTALMVAATACHENIVDFLVRNSNISEKDKVTALKLAGASFIDRMDDIETGLRLWKRAARILRSDQKQSSVEFTDRQDGNCYYGNMKEFHSVEDLQDLEMDLDSVYFQSLLLRERILGHHNPSTTIAMRRRATVFVRHERKRKQGLNLLLYTLNRQQINYKPLDSTQTLHTLALFCNLFSYKTIVEDGKQRTAFEITHFDEVFPVFKAAVEEIRRVHDDSLLDRTLPDMDEDYTFAVSCTLQLLSVVLDVKEELSAEQAVMLNSSVRYLLNLNPILNGNVTLLHFASSRPTYQDTFDIDLSFPNHKVVQILLDNGADVNALDSNRNTPLHSVCTGMKRKIKREVDPTLEEQKQCVQVLLEHGVHLDARNIEGRTFKDLSFLTFSFCRVTCEPLQCLAARVIVSYNIPYKHILPGKLQSFVQMHEHPHAEN